MKIKSCGTLNRLKNFHHLLFVVIAASLLLSGDAFACTPNIDNTGVYYDNIEIAKSDMPRLEKDVDQMIYSGDYQEFLDLQNVSLEFIRLCRMAFLVNIVVGLKPHYY